MWRGPYSITVRRFTQDFLDDFSAPTKKINMSTILSVRRSLFKRVLYSTTVRNFTQNYIVKFGWGDFLSQFSNDQFSN